MKAFAWLLCWLFACLGEAYAQSPTAEQLIGTWIGESTEVDIGWIRPFAYRMTFRADSIVQLAAIANGAAPRTVRWQMKDRVMQLDTIKFGTGQWTITGDQLRISAWESQRFRRLVNIPQDSTAVRGKLIGRIWDTDSLSYSLFEDGSVCLKSKKTGSVTLHYWHLVPVETSLFLIVKGTHKDTDSYPHFPLQITQLSENMLSVRGWNGQRWGDFTLTRTDNLKPDQHCQPEGFQLCNTFLVLVQFTS